MAKFAGHRERRFIDIYSDQADEMQRNLFEYIKLLRMSTSNPQELSSISRSRTDLIITTKDGYPWMPNEPEDIEQKKDELEILLRTYLNAQYSEEI